ncbi:hypothetical protein BHE74_00000755 [Ensete ventricosum]|nr:hypothetical protein BHE74_00000755 [Ensete ventricosum]
MLPGAALLIQISYNLVFPYQFLLPTSPNCRKDGARLAPRITDGVVRCDKKCKSIVDCPGIAQLQDIERSSNSRSSSDGYVGLFVRMLGLDNDPLDREQAISTLWKYSQGGKNCIDGIMQFPGCINLVVSLLKSESSCTCEAAAGLLRTVSAVSIYRNVVSESGAIEEIASLLCRPSLTSEVFAVINH